MKLAMMSDIHANIQALDACLAHAQNQGATHYAFLGDLVGYGADPAAVVQFAAQQIACARDGAGSVVEGSANSVQRVFYLWALVQL